jgi:hypothetical protein
MEADYLIFDIFRAILQTIGKADPAGLRQG